MLRRGRSGYLPVRALFHTELDLLTAPGYSFEPTDALLRGFDQNVREAREALAAAQDADFAVPWSLKRGGQVLFTALRGAVVRSHMRDIVTSGARLPCWR